MNEIIDTGDVALYEAYDNRYVRREARFGVERRVLKKMPVIVVSAYLSDGPLADRMAVAAEIRSACIDIGFFYLRGHGVPLSELDDLNCISKDFFKLPLEEKMKIHASKSVAHRGFISSGGVTPEKANDKFPDIKERYMMSHDTLPGEAAGKRVGASQWPDANVSPEFKTFMQRHMVTRLLLAQRLMRAFALSLELPENHFDDVYARPSATLALNFYPHIEEAQLDRTQWSFSPHTDYGGVTLLTQDEVGGLQARNAAGEWIDISPLEGAFVINLGDMFAMWTNDLYSSNLHRAMNMTGKARFSAAFFTAPNSDTILRCLPTCTGPGNPWRYEEIRAGDYNDALVGQYHAAGRPGLSTGTAKRLKAN